MPASSQNATKMRPSDSTETLEHAKDVTKPGLWISRTKSLRTVETVGGSAVLSSAWLNRGTNFALSERKELGIEGLVPPVVESLDIQAERVLEQLSAPNLRPLNQFNILSQLQAQDTTLFYKVLIDNIAALAPVIYTPTVGEACKRWDHIYRGATTGIYLSAFQHRGRFASILRNWPSHNVQIAVITDGSRILGLGDLGTNGMGIPVGKVALFVAAGGFHPEHSLPIVLDVGTNNEELLNDKFYMGERRRRLERDEYFAVIEEVCNAFSDVWPNALLQFEDFETSHAFEILKRRRDKQLCFNDDIQGTGAVVTAGVVNGLRVQGTKPADARIVFFGAGSSAVGVAQAVATYFEHENGVPRELARKCIYMVDSKGLITEEERGDDLPPHKRLFARQAGDGTPCNLHYLRDIIAAIKPHALVGLSAAGPSWDRETIQELCKHCERPLVFPLSNPTDKSEITAENAIEFSEGRCVFASGSPFAPVNYQGRELVPGQANNVFIFPGTGFGAVMAKATSVTDAMFTAAATALAGCVSEQEIMQEGRLYPEMSELRQVSAKVAAAVAAAAWECGVSSLDEEPTDWLKHVQQAMWDPNEAKTTRVSGM